MQTHSINGQDLHVIQDEEFTLIYDSADEARREVKCRQFHSVLALGFGIALVVAAFYFENTIPNSYWNQVREDGSAQPTAIDLVSGIILLASLKCFKDAYRLRASMSSLCRGLFERRQPSRDEAVELDAALLNVNGPSN
jgi:hypothetical protein